MRKQCLFTALKAFASIFLAIFLLVVLPFQSITFAQLKQRTPDSRNVKTVPKTPAETKPTSSISLPTDCSEPVQENTKRVALVIGNRDYKLRPLINPVNDARLVAKALREVGFEVILREDQSNEQLNDAVQEFSRRLVAGGVGLFYYAGHGVQFSDRNYLVPVDFVNIDKLSGENVEKELFYVGRVLEVMVAKKCLNILILDACRNAPVDLLFPQGTAAGFAEIKSTTYGGTYIAFATSPGDVAADGKGYSNSPYSYWLADSLRLTPARIEDVFMRTRIQVERVLDSKQIPWESSSLKQQFYFTSDNLEGLPKEKNFYSLSLKIPNSLFKTEKFNIWLINENGTITARKSGTAKFYIENLRMPLAALTQLEMTEIRGGKFAMGSNNIEALLGYNESKKDGNDVGADWAVNEMPQHCVGVSSFYISRYEITQGQWSAVMGSLPADIPQPFLGWNMPVVNVSWEDAVLFCENLTRLTGKAYRLPTEAEWEYAARAGSKTPFAFGKTLTPAIANYFWLVGFGSGPSGREPLRRIWNVGESNIANANGLFDMNGNAAEWCEDIYFNNYNGAPKDGSARQADADSENSRVIRGGSWEDIPAHSRSTSRWNAAFDRRSTAIGFRVVAK